MRYARLFSWLIFVLFFLVYLTAIKLVRGTNWPIQQQFIQQVAPFYTLQYPYKTSLQTAASAALQQQPQALQHHPETSYVAPVPLDQSGGVAKEARELGAHHVSFENEQNPQDGQLVQQQSGPEQQQPAITRRHHLPAAQSPSNQNVLQGHSQFAPKANQQPQFGQQQPAQGE